MEVRFLVDKSFGMLLKELREKRGLTVNQLGIYSEVSPGLISKIENGKRGRPKADTLEKIAKGLKMDYNELMRMAGYLEPEDKKTAKLKRESTKPLSESKIDKIIRETEERYKVSLRDDPVVETLVREVLQGIAKTKKGG
jgi:transcriptional regulator with XRE-family HTH domain